MPEEEEQMQRQANGNSLPQEIREEEEETLQTKAEEATPIQRLCAECEQKAPVLQPKLTVGPAQDAYEQEADRVADHVANALLAPGTNPNRAQTQGHPPAITPLVMRQGEGTVTPSPQVEQGIQQSRGGGEAIAPPLRQSMEQAFDADFSPVRVHTNSQANQLNRSLNARAFTTGKDIYFNQGEYQPDSQAGQKLLAHELTHVVQQTGMEGERNPVQRWNIGTAPAPAGWEVVTDRQQLRRLNQAESIVRSVLTSRRCQNHFSGSCGTANALQDTFDNSNVYLRPFDDNVFGERTGRNIAFNLRSFRIGRYMMASTLLHEMFHTCDPTPRATQNLREFNAENAVEVCRLHTPWIDVVSPRSAAVGSRITIRGWGFGPTQGSTDEVRIGGIPAIVVSWAFMTDNSSRVEIVAEVPAGTAGGGVTIVNNGVVSNVARFTVV
ncbi:MAG: DUF4157 domain-containing protein [Leptolyngbyaceae cyanobacterium SM2_5_2]|nr:DUF4157 domain-containing protein [Leptolyngbyaceae cyanobacterium SM2_5_2]